MSDIHIISVFKSKNIIKSYLIKFKYKKCILIPEVFLTDDEFLALKCLKLLKTEDIVNLKLSEYNTLKKLNKLLISIAENNCT